MNTKKIISLCFSAILSFTPLVSNAKTYTPDDEPKFSEFSTFQRAMLRSESRRAKNILNQIIEANNLNEEANSTYPLYISTILKGANYRSDGAIIINKDFLESLDDNELALVLAHELSHAINSDNGRVILKAQEISNKTKIPVEKILNSKKQHPEITKIRSQIERRADHASISLAIQAGFTPNIDNLFEILDFELKSNKSMHGHMDLQTRKNYLNDLLETYSKQN